MDLWDTDTADVVAFLREVTQGEGLTVSGVEAALQGGEREVTDRLKLEEIIDQITSASELIVNQEHRDAIRNALGIAGQGDTLTERRMGYLTNVDISLRTLQRHEEKGAEAIAKLLPRVSQTRSQGIEHIMERLDDIEALLLRSILVKNFHLRNVELEEQRGWEDALNAERSAAIVRMLRRLADRTPEG